METKTRFFRQLFSLTYDDKKFPTDLELDSKMRVAIFHLHELETLTKYILKRKIKLFFKYKWILVVKKIVYLALFLMLIYFGYNY